MYRKRIEKWEVLIKRKHNCICHLCSYKICCHHYTSILTFLEMPTMQLIVSHQSLSSTTNTWTCNTRTGRSMRMMACLPVSYLLKMMLQVVINVRRSIWRCTHAKLAPLTPHPLAQDRHYGPASGLQVVITHVLLVQRKGFMLHQHLFLQDHSFDLPIFLNKVSFLRNW